MAVRKNIGKIAGALRAGVKANQNTNYGPIPDFSLDLSQYSVGDWYLEDTKPKAFLMSLHKWGDRVFKVVGD